MRWAGVTSVINGFLTTVAGAITMVVTAMQGEGFQNFVSALVRMLTTIGGSLVSALQPAAEGIRELFKAFLSGDSGVIQSIADAFGAFAEWFENSLAPIIGAVASAIVTLFKPFVESITPIITAIAGAIGILFGNFTTGKAESSTKIADAVAKLLGTFVGGLDGIIKNIATAITTFADTLFNKEGTVSTFSDTIGLLAERFDNVLGYAMDLGVEISNLILDLADLETDFKGVFEGLGGIIGTAVGAVAEELDKLIDTLGVKFSSVGELFMSNTGIGNLLSFLSPDGIAEANDLLNSIGEGVWWMGKEAVNAAVGVHQQAQIEEHSELLNRVHNVPVNESTVSKVIEDQNNYLTQMNFATGGSQMNQPINMVLDGYKVGDAILPYLLNAAKRQDIPVGVQK